MFEATTVFQRTRTQKMLGGMSPQPSPVHVYRCNKWTIVLTKDLLPGDIISLSYKRPHKESSQALEKKDNNQEPSSATTPTPAPTPATQQPKTSSSPHDDIVPCDCIILRGSAVVNEASLTGESVPQMKEALVHSGKNIGGKDEECLDMNGVHRVSVLFSGTSIVTIEGNSNVSINSIPPPPDHGAIAYVLRTGFSSSQGD
jgi:cation-transporting ATPase 13A1